MRATWKRRSLEALLLPIALVASVAVSAAYHVGLPAGMARIRGVVEQALAATLRGRVSLGRIEEASFGRIALRDVTVDDASGMRVIEAKHVYATPELGALLEGRVVIHEVTVDGGRLVVRWPNFERDPLPSFVDAFFPKEVTPPSPSPVEVHIAKASLRGVRVEADIPGFGPLTMTDTHATLRVDAAQDVTLHFADAGGRIERPFTDALVVTHLSGTFSTDETAGLALSAQAATAQGEDRLRARVTFRATAAGREPELRVEAFADPVRMKTLAEAGQAWALALRGSCRGPVEFSGPTNALTLRASPECEGGRLEVHGAFPERGAFVELTTAGLDLSRIAPAPSPLTVAGRARLEFPASGAADATTRLRAELKPFEFAGQRVPESRIEARLEADHVALDAVRLTSKHLDGTIRGRVGYDGTLALEVRAEVDALEATPELSPWLEGAEGRAAASGSLAFDGETWSSRLRLDLTGFTYGPLSVTRGHAEGTVRVAAGGPELSVAFHAEGTRAGSVDLGRADGRLRGRLAALSAELNLEAPGPRALSAKAVLALEGDRTRVTGATFDLKQGPDTWRGAAESLTVTRDGEAVLSGFELTRGDERIRAECRYAPGTAFEGKASATKLDLSAWASLAGLPRERIRGTASGQVWATGTPEAPRWRAEGSVQEGKIYGVPTSGAAVLEYQDGTLAIDAQTALTANGSATLSGSVLADTAANNPVDQILGGIFDVRVSLRGFDAGLIEADAVAGRAQISGDMAGSLHLKGPLFAPELTGEVLLPSVTFTGWPALTLDAAFRYENAYLVAHARTADLHGELAEVEGALLVDLVGVLSRPRETIQMLESLPWRVAARVPVRSADRLPEPVRARLPEALRGARLGMSATFEGGASKPEGEVLATLDLADPSALGGCRGSPPMKALLEATLADDRTEATLRAFSGALPLGVATVTVDTPVNAWLTQASVPETPRTEAHVLLNQTPAERVPFLCRSWRGPITAELTLRDAFTRAMTGSVSVQSPSLRLPKVAPFRMDLGLTVDAEEIRGKAQFGWWTSERAVAEASVPLRWPKGARTPELDADNAVFTLDVQNAPVAPFSALLPKVDEAEGRLDGVVEARGKPGAMEMSGELRLTEGQLQLESTGQRLTGMEGLFILHRDWIEIDGLTAADGRGSLRVDGGLLFEGWKPTSLKAALRAERFPVRRDGAVLASLTGAASLAGEFRETADIVLGLQQLEIRMPKASDRQAQPLDAHPDIHLVGAVGEGTAEQPYVLNVVIDGASPFWVRRDDFAVQVSAELNATYASPDLFLGGYVEMKDGRFSVYGRQFNIDWGAINFDGSEGLDPSVNLSAVHRLRGGGTVTVTVSGTFTRPEVTFASSEATDPGEIISLLVTGRKASRGADPAEASRQTGDFVAGFLSGFLSLTLREALGNYMPQFAVDASGSFRAGKDLDFLVPKPLRSVVLGVYFEGQLAPSESSGAGGSSSSTTSSSGSAASSTTQLLLELQFPYDLFFEGLWAPPDRWRLDLLWEP